MLYTRELLEEFEKKALASYAVKSAESRGRVYPEKEDTYRLCFQRDKERIIHSKAFRRLDEKTQVFMAGSGDHYRTRLTHTLEVAQVARGIGRRLGANEDLCETIALAHDLGHPPYGHAGEEALNEVMSEFGMHFEHNEQSRRVVEKLEKSYPHFDGLNLTVEVLEGMIKHQTAWDQAGKMFEVSAHLEAQIVNLADEIAYTNHDIDDGIRSGLITLEQLNKFEVWSLACKKSDDPKMISRCISALMTLMIEDLCQQTEKNLVANKIVTPEDVASHNGLIACFSPEMSQMLKELRGFLYENFYMNPLIDQLVIKGKTMIKKLFLYYVANPEKFPKNVAQDKKEFIMEVKDYIAGMTDHFMIEEFEKTL